MNNIAFSSLQITSSVFSHQNEMLFKNNIAFFYLLIINFVHSDSQIFQLLFENESNHILIILQKSSISKLRYQNLSSFRTFTKRQAQQAMWFLIHLDICELEACTYNCLTHKWDCEVVNVFLHDFDCYLDISLKFIFEVSVWFILSSSNFAFEVQNKFIFNSILNSYENHVCRILFQMNKKLYLIIFITQEKMKKICQKKC